MADDTDELDAETRETDRADPADWSPSESLDSAAESFLTIEDELSDPAPEGVRYGQVVGVERVSPSAVPEDYPREIGDDVETVIALEIRTGELDADTVPAYFAWPDDADTPLGRLLAALDVPPDSFADLYGTRLLMRLSEGYLVPVVPPSHPRGSDAWVYGVGGGLLVNLLTAGLYVAGATSVLTALPFLALFLLVNLLLIPYATYRDAWHLRTHTDWNQGPLFWAVCSLLWGVNVFVSAAYLYSRSKARPLEK